MTYNFTRTISEKQIQDILLSSLGISLSSNDRNRLNIYRRNWNFYEGYHWEGIEYHDKPQITENLIRPFVNNFISFELGGGFNISMLPKVETVEGENNPHAFLEKVWEYNNRLEFGTELGQEKSITGDGWVQVSFAKADNLEDPYGEFPDGKISINVLPSSICFPEYYEERHKEDKLKRFTIMYPIPKVGRDGKTSETEYEVYRQVWTIDRVSIYVGERQIQTMVNKYKFIPYIQIKNFPLHGKREGVSDIEDLIPLNAELNLKMSDISEIIDYHSAPITVVYGARIGDLERGANKVWGGLPVNGKVENLRLEGDLTLANSYIERIKRAMHEVGNIPEGVLGGDLNISNTSGVALQIMLLPLLERVKVKQVLTKEGIEEVNKAVLLIAEKEGLIKVPSELTRYEFFRNEVTFNSILPKDEILELQGLEMEMKLGLESREGAMKRVGKSHIQKKIEDIDEDMKKNPEIYGKVDINKELEMQKTKQEVRKVGENKEGKGKKINAGFTNSPEQSNKIVE